MSLIVLTHEVRRAGRRGVHTPLRRRQRSISADEEQVRLRVQEEGRPGVGRPRGVHFYEVRFLLDGEARKGLSPSGSMEPENTVCLSDQLPGIGRRPVEHRPWVRETGLDEVVAVVAHRHLRIDARGGPEIRPCRFATGSDAANSAVDGDIGGESEDDPAGRGDRLCRTGLAGERSRADFVARGAADGRPRQDELAVPGSHCDLPRRGRARRSGDLKDDSAAVVVRVGITRKHSGRVAGVHCRDEAQCEQRRRSGGAERHRSARDHGGRLRSNLHREGMYGRGLGAEAGERDAHHGPGRR